MSATRFHLTYDLKLRIQKYAHENSNLTQLEIKRWVKREFGVKVGRSTVSRVLKEDLSTQKKLRGQSKVKFPDLERELLDFVYDNYVRNLLSDVVLKKKVVELRRKYGIPEKKLNLSKGWLEKFMDRHLINPASVYMEEKALKEPDGKLNSHISSPHASLEKVISSYEAKDVFIMHEVGLYFRLLPGIKPSIRREDPAYESRKKDFVNVVLCCNIDGSEKLNPVVIGKPTKPASLRNAVLKDLPISYVSNQSAWLSAELFMKWTQNVSSQMINRKILLLVSNAPTHVCFELPNFRVQFLPTNVPHPILTGIAQNFKTHYRTFYLRWFLNQSLAKAKAKRLDLLLAMRFMIEGWSEVSPSIIEGSWKEVRGHWNQKLDQKTERTDQAEQMNALVKLYEVTRELQLTKIMDISQYVSLDNDLSPNLEKCSAAYEPMNVRPMSDSEAMAHMLSLRDYLVENKYEKDECRMFAELLKKFRQNADDPAARDSKVKLIEPSTI